MIRVARILTAYVPQSLTNFKDNDTNSAACDLFQKFNRQYNNVGKAIALTRNILTKQGFDMTVAPSASVTLPPSVPRKKKPEEDYPSLFSAEDLKWS